MNAEPQDATLTSTTSTTSKKHCLLESYTDIQSTTGMSPAYGRCKPRLTNYLAHSLHIHHYSSRHCRSLPLLCFISHHTIPHHAVFVPDTVLPFVYMGVPSRAPLNEDALVHSLYSFGLSIISYVSPHCVSCFTDTCLPACSWIDTHIHFRLHVQ